MRPQADILEITSSFADSVLLREGFLEVTLTIANNGLSVIQATNIQEPLPALFQAWPGTLPPAVSAVALWVSG
jgi:hypothetical protein